MALHLYVISRKTGREILETGRGISAPSRSRAPVHSEKPKRTRPFTSLDHVLALLVAALFLGQGSPRKEVVGPTCPLGLAGSSYTLVFSGLGYDKVKDVEIHRTSSSCDRSLK